MATFVLLNVIADIATQITGEEISVSNKHLDQNERLDDFGSRIRPHFFSDRNLNIHEMKRTRTMVSRQRPRLFPCLSYCMVDFCYIEETIECLM